MIYPLNMQVNAPKTDTIINNIQQFRNVSISIFRLMQATKKAA